MTTRISRLGEARKQIQIAEEKLDDEALAEALQKADSILETVEGELAERPETHD